MPNNDLFRPMVERVLELGAYEGPKDLPAVVEDIFRVANTLLQGSGGDYCACQTFPCECVEVFWGDLVTCVTTRHPGAPLPNQQTGASDDRSL